MSTMTLEELRDQCIELIGRVAVDGSCSSVAVAAVSAMFAQLLRERESAKAAVTDEIRAHASFIYRKTTDGNCNELGMLNALEAVAPMLASARVPERKPLPDLLLASYHEAVGWNACRDAMLAAAPKSKES